MGDFNPFPLLYGIAKTITPNDSSTVDNHPIPYLASIQNGGMGIQNTMLPNRAILPHIDPGIKKGPSANLRAFPHIREWK
jgi:hypothetical protein